MQKLSEEAKRRKYKYVAEWGRKHAKTITFTLNKEKDKDIISVLSAKENVAAYIKNLIRKYENLDSKK